MEAVAVEDAPGNDGREPFALRVEVVVGDVEQERIDGWVAPQRVGALEVAGLVDEPLGGEQPKELRTGFGGVPEVPVRVVERLSDLFPFGEHVEWR